MPLPLAENVAQVTLRWNAGVGTERAHIVLHYKNSVGWNAGSLLDLGTTINTVVENDLMGGAPTSLIYEGCTAVDLGAEGAVPVDIPTEPIEGSQSVDMNPPQVALVISWRTNNASRSGRGRSYVPGVPRAGMPDLSHVSTAYRETVEAFAQGLIDAGPAQFPDAALGVLSRYSGKDEDGKPLPKDPPDFYPVSLAIVNSRVDTQRRRLPRI